MCYESPKSGCLEIQVSFKKYINKGFILEAAIDKGEIAKLLRIADRDILEAAERCHDVDWQFAIAYNASLQLATVALRASGYRASTKAGHHWVTFALLPDILGDTFIDSADYFNACRIKRNTTEYCDTGTISKQEAEQLIHEAKMFKAKIVSWLKKHHPHLLL